MAGKAVVVTGAGRGIGREIALMMAAEGAAVVVNDVGAGLDGSGHDRGPAAEVAAAIREAGGEAVVNADSVAEAKGGERMIADALDAFGRIDAVVNNTGHPAKGELLELADEDWHDGLDLILLSVLRLAREVTPVMERQGGGALVNVSSLWAAEPSLDAPVSSTLRAALSALTKLYADRFAPRGIRINTVLAGFFDSHPVSEDVRRGIPVGRVASVDEIASVVAFLLSPQASYVTGQSLRADGGLTRSVSL